MPALELLLDFDFLGFDFSSRASSLNDSFLYRKLIKELPDKLSVEVWVAVFSKLIENEPVAQIGLVEDELETFPDLVIVLPPHLNTVKWRANWLAGGVLPSCIAGWTSPHRRRWSGFCRRWKELRLEQGKRTLPGNVWSVFCVQCLVTRTRERGRSSRWWYSESRRRVRCVS